MKFDSWESYFYPETYRPETDVGVLRNLYGERSQAQLDAREYAETDRQQVRIASGAVHIDRTNDAAHLRAIHRALFGNVYEWAGEYRTVAMGKDTNIFAPVEHIDTYLAGAASIVEQAPWSSLDRDEFAVVSAAVFAYVNQAHPFREGNGRASKLFLQHLSEQSPWRLNYDPLVSGIGAVQWNQAARLSAPKSGEAHPNPDSLIPVFRAYAEVRPDPQQDARSVSVPGLMSNTSVQDAMRAAGQQAEASPRTSQNPRQGRAR